MNKISDKEYLQNPLVEGVKYIITDDYIQIECSHTSWIKSKRLNILKNLKE